MSGVLVTLRNELDELYSRNSLEIGFNEMLQAFENKFWSMAYVTYNSTVHSQRIKQNESPNEETVGNLLN